MRYLDPVFGNLVVTDACSLVSAKIRDMRCLVAQDDVVLVTAVEQQVSGDLTDAANSNTPVCYSAEYGHIMEISHENGEPCEQKQKKKGS